MAAPLRIILPLVNENTSSTHLGHHFAQVLERFSARDESRRRGAPAGKARGGSIDGKTKRATRIGRNRQAHWQTALGGPGRRSQKYGARVDGAGSAGGRQRHCDPARDRLIAPNLFLGA